MAIPFWDGIIPRRQCVWMSRGESLMDGWLGGWPNDGHRPRRRCYYYQHQKPWLLPS